MTESNESLTEERRKEIFAALVGGIREHRCRFLADGYPLAL